jgi:methylated-DNA-[protein]-cysteine S-methyltransferase
MLAHYTSFETSLGACGLAWTPRGVAWIRLPVVPEGAPGGSAAMDRMLAEQFPDARLAEPTPCARVAIDAITRSLAGADTDFNAIVLDDHDVPPFARRVYAEARRIPRGETRSYGDLARALGKPGASRAVGQALGRNPFPLVVPCHRVVARGGAAGGFTAPGGLTTKARLLAIEGMNVAWGPATD